MVSENVEEYLECIWELTHLGKPAKTTDIAEELKVSPGSLRFRNRRARWRGTDC